MGVARTKARCVLLLKTRNVLLANILVIMIGVPQVWSQPTSQLASEEARNLMARLLALPASQLENAVILLRENHKLITKDLVRHLLDVAFSVPARDERALFINKLRGKQPVF